MTPDNEPSTTDLLAFYAEKTAEIKQLKAELSRLEDIQAGVEEIVLGRMPPEVDSMNHVTESGVRMKIARRTSERYQPPAGQSDDFWGWVRTTGQWSMTSRTVLQAGVSAYAAEHGQLPPHIEVAKTEKCNITVTTPAPKA